MKFLDANVFVYAFYKPRRKLTKPEETMKALARKAASDVSHGEERILTTVVHVSEMANILKRGMPLDELHEAIFGLMTLDNVTVSGVSREDYFAATELGMDLKLDPNDALAVQVMKTHGVTEMYSFDRDFERVKGITRLPKVD